MDKEYYSKTKDKIFKELKIVILTTILIVSFFL